MKYLAGSAIVLALFFSACSKTDKSSATTVNASESVPPVLKVLTVSELLANPGTYDGSEIALKGTVVHVCKHSGKRLHLLGSDEASQIRLEAGAIGQFDKSLEGSEIIARGIFHLGVHGQGQHAGGNMENHDGTDAQGTGKGKMMMEGESEPGEMQGDWVDGISFETVASE
jgi:hypothetical protein